MSTRLFARVALALAVLLPLSVSLGESDPTPGSPEVGVVLPELVPAPGFGAAAVLGFVALPPSALGPAAAEVPQVAVTPTPKLTTATAPAKATPAKAALTKVAPSKATPAKTVARVTPTARPVARVKVPTINPAPATAALGRLATSLKTPMVVAQPKPKAQTPVIVARPVPAPKAAAKPAQAAPPAKPALVAKPAPKPAPAPSARLATFTLRATAYNSLRGQTDSTPFITATGARTRFGVVALSRDMLRRIPYGSLLRLEDMGTWSGGRGRGAHNRTLSSVLFVVEDTMHPRKSGQIDVWFPARRQAIQWGVRRVKVTVVQYGRKRA